MLATYMQRMRNNNLEIRIAGDKEAILGQVPRKMVKFNPVFSQILRANAQKKRANRGHSSKPNLPSF